MDNLLMQYSHLGLHEVSEVLRLKHGVELSARAVGKRSREIGIYRRRVLTTEQLHELAATLQELLPTLPSTAGYRVVWQHLKQKLNIYVSRKTVMQLMQVVSTENVSRRTLYSLKRRVYSVPGANYLWHIDGYDKAKKFGLAIHGGIDGYSRKVLWLEVGPTNNNPKVVGAHFLRAANQAGGLPKLVRGDLGSENVVIEKIQRVLRSSLHNDSRKDTAFLYGKSCFNQRIERFWGSLHSMGLSHILNHLSALEGIGVFSTSNPLHIEAVRFCYMGVMRKCLHDFVEHWNFHHIRKSSTNSIGGKPELLYLQSSTNYLQLVDKVHFSEASSLVSQVCDVDPHFAEAADLLLEQFNAESVSVMDAAEEKLRFLISAADIAVRK